jgi:hypothetical protein
MQDLSNSSLPRPNGSPDSKLYSSKQPGQDYQFIIPRQQDINTSATSQSNASISSGNVLISNHIQTMMLVSKGGENYKSKKNQIPITNRTYTVDNCNQKY